MLPTTLNSPSDQKNVWKVGSRWSHTGTAESSIIDLFRRNNIVFTNRHTHIFEQINEGDLITISDGLKIIALGLAITPPQPVTQFNLKLNEEDRSKFNPENDVLACRITFIDLKKEDYQPCRQGAFHRVNKDAEKLLSLYGKYQDFYNQQQSFEINASSCTLINNEKCPEDILWSPNNTLQIPVYQRAYSWQEPEVKRLLYDLLASFYGRNGRTPQEPMFIGTVQLSTPVPIEKTQPTNQQNNIPTQQDVIDGQQRSTTLLLIFKAIQLLCPDLELWNKTKLEGRIKTSVSGGEMQKYLSIALGCDQETLLTTSDNDLNIYMLRLKFVFKELLDEDNLINIEDDADSKEQKVTSLINYLSAKVYFVVIETRANLSKTLQIFDSINTSGMDLNGGDIFKVRFYDYLRETNKEQTDQSQVFDEISNLYKKIAEKNQACGKEIVNIESVLRVAQNIVISEAHLAESNRKLAGSTFFERLFDTVLDVNRWEGLNKEGCLRVQLTIEKLAKIIDMLFDWHNAALSKTSIETQISSHLIWYSRYGRHFIVQHLFNYAYNPKPAEMDDFISEFSKLLTSYSLIYKKAVSACHTLVNNIMGKMLAPKEKVTLPELLCFIKEHRQSLNNEVHHALNTHPIAHIPRSKNLILRIDAMLDELAESKQPDDLHKLLFDTPIDIEHIESANHIDIEERKKTHLKWGDKLHQLGNLIVLESGINRSISNGSYSAKKLPGYKGSEFISVRNLAENYSSWDECSMDQRHNQLVSKLTDYLCK